MATKSRGIFLRYTPPGPAGTGEKVDKNAADGIG
jgi:hypothetical protein